MHEVIVVGVDGSQGGFAAVAEGAEFAKRFNAHLIALSVEEGLPRFAATMGEVDEFKEEKNRYFKGVAERATQVAAEHGVTLHHEIRVGHAEDAIVRFADDVGADLVILGFKGHSRIGGFLIGTTAQRVNAHARASVFIVKPTGRLGKVWDQLMRGKSLPDEERYQKDRE
jgi:nucleotide-binding universal stress UspA family protein